MGKNVRTFIAALSLVVSLGVLIPFSGITDDQPKSPQQKSGCVTWTAEARMVGYAFDHLVHLASGCKHVMTCEIKTNVNPKAVHVALKKNEKETVLTFRGSPARSFTAQVKCEKK